ncbi:MAG: ABC transporter permease, partial [Chloroflexota bacterium]
MTKYIVRRLVSAIPVLIGLSIVLFAFIHLLPGDPTRAILGQHATPETTARLREALNLDKPLWEQYVLYMGDLLRGDLGRSLVNNRPVLNDFIVRFPATVELTLVALLFAVGLGIPLGRLAGRHPQGWIDGTVTLVSLLGISIPIFVLGLTLQYLMGVRLGLLPVSSRIDPRITIDAVTHFMLIDTVLAGKWEAFVDALRHLVLPAIALGSIPLAIITRITRASVLDVA